ncbi:hypothetical protein UFOVP329_33 [uncultured Caudovirales phage]|uniref:Uncharacterized protein n=1 Tax=uncultured Caudovirales phage TaxID=2100421 RepID=A0A6J5LW28_9CAUD|nr:hypothetical protein UFOVP329_33 [uncultured Caudovirales phage]
MRWLIIMADQHADFHKPSRKSARSFGAEQLTESEASAALESMARSPGAVDLRSMSLEDQDKFLGHATL